MKVLGYDDGGVVMIGSIGPDNTVTPLAQVDAFYADLSEWIAAVPSGPTLMRAELALRPPVPATAKVICVGMNYASHVAETKRQMSQHPVLFSRYASTLISDGDEIPVPPGEDGMDWEVELAAIVGQRLSRSTPEECLAGVFGYTAFNDVTAREHQFHTHQFMLGKNPDRSAPIGPQIVTADQFAPDAVQVETRVNGDVMQTGNTSDLIFKVGPTLSYVSQVMTLNPGDVLATGTPGGIGYRREPRVLMHPGDKLETFIEGIGTLTNRIATS
jgi:2-keto-4-pentenoate hydratase/2-oxohepta-3-ene-1,7-dioic acid hydratase in catechol pathway